MIRAVDQRNVEINHRETERAVLQRVDNSLLDRRDVIARHHPAGNLVLEGKTRPARHRLDFEHDVAVLAVTARLLLMTAALRNAFADGFAVADTWLPTLNGNAVTIAEAPMWVA